MKKCERESVIRWDSESKIVTIDSLHPSVWRRLEKAGYRSAKIRQLDGVEIGRVYRVPLANFRFRVKPLNAPRRSPPPGAFKRKGDIKNTEKLAAKPRSGLAIPLSENDEKSAVVFSKDSEVTRRMKANVTPRPTPPGGFTEKRAEKKSRSRSKNPDGSG